MNFSCLASGTNIVKGAGKKDAKIFGAAVVKNIEKKAKFNPFKNKTPAEIDVMFRAKGFSPRGPNPKKGKGGDVNPKSERSYHIDPQNRFNEPPHVDVNRPRQYILPTVQDRSRLLLKAGRFPNEVDFPPQMFDAILASGALHYLTVDEFEDAIRIIFKLVKKNGKFFFFSSTPYISLFKGFLPIYQKRKKGNIKWPGYIANCWTYAPHRKNHVTKQIHLLDEDILEPFFLTT